MNNLAVLLTCFNRKTKTLNALEQIKKAQKRVENQLHISVYLTDDGSTDGTSEAVKSNHPKVNILKGTGELFWAGGMRKSWRSALRSTYDGYLLLNDDTDVSETLFEAFLQAHKYSVNTFGMGGIYIGSTKDPKTHKLTYGGAVLTHKFAFKYQHLEPTEAYQKCDLGNANILFVAKNVVEKIGILSEGYKHGVADYDYTLRAVKKKIPVLIMPGFLGVCSNDHSDIYEKFARVSIKERIKLMQSPIGLDFSSYLNLMKRHYPIRVPLIVFAAGLKLFFPKSYLKLSDSR